MEEVGRRRKEGTSFRGGVKECLFVSAAKGLLPWSSAAIYGEGPRRAPGRGPHVSTLLPHEPSMPPKRDRPCMRLALLAAIYISAASNEEVV